MSITYAICIQEGEFSQTLTRGRRYPIIAVYDEKERVYIQADNGKKAWFPFTCFKMDDEASPTFEQITVERLVSGPIEHSMRATLRMPSGERRWCWFATPRILAKSSEFIEGTYIWLHYDNANLILLSALSEESARQAIDHIHQNGDLFACTLPPITP